MPDGMAKLDVPFDLRLWHVSWIMWKVGSRELNAFSHS